MEGLEVDSTPFIRHLEKSFLKKVESPGQDKLSVGVSLLPPC
jgi:hypothetical protein